MSKVMPQRYGKYILLRRLALGGMAEIFKAKVAGAEGFERELVIKRILPHFSDDQAFVSMFIDEARITARLQHPNIVQIHDFDFVDDSYYIAMEYIEGRDLKDVLEETFKQKDLLSVPQCVWIAMEVAKGLHYAHTKEDKGQPLNIVHRDVTPSNVMISYRGDVKLMDFGIAKAAQRSTKTQAGAVKGKVAYMSPEQARGKAIDGRTDVFALGVMFWEMLTGRRLFMADSDFETLSRVLKMPAPPPSTLDPRCPTDLDAIVGKCLAKDPEQRFASAKALGRELTRWFYSHVTDLEKEKLKPLMYRVFKKDIERLERQAGEDDKLVAGAAGAPKKPLNAEATALKPAVSDALDGRPTTPTSMNAEATAMLQAVGDDPEPPSKSGQSTRVNQPEMGTSVMYPDTFEPPTSARRSGSKLTWVLLALLLAGGAVALYFLVLDKPATVSSAHPANPVSEAHDGAKD